MNKYHLLVIVCLCLFCIPISGSCQQGSVAANGATCDPAVTAKVCEQAQLAALFKRLDGASAMTRRKVGAANDPLMIKYASAIQAAVTKNWLLPDGLPQAACKVHIVQLPGGKVERATVDESCPYDQRGRRSVVDAVLRADYLPYGGFESVFQRNIVLTFFPPTK